MKTKWKCVYIILLQTVIMYTIHHYYLSDIRIETGPKEEHPQIINVANQKINYVQKEYLTKYKGLHTYKTLRYKKLDTKIQKVKTKAKTHPEYVFTSLEGIKKTIWKQIQQLQEEGDCESKKIIFCENAGNIAGLGSMIHRYGVCMQTAYGLGRIWFINQQEYEHFGGLKRFLKPESKRCGYLKEKYKDVSKCNVQEKDCYEPNGYDIDSSHKVLTYKSELKFPHPRHIPTTLPREIEIALLKFKIKNPWLWFSSQFLGYLMLRPNNELMEKISYIRNITNLKYPYVALHIRRGDKVTSGEGNYMSEANYLRPAEEYFKKYFPNAIQRNIYIASDDNNIKTRLKLLTSTKYQFFSHTNSQQKDYGRLRYSLEAIETMLIDLYFLTYSNYTICTFSSNIGRLIFDLKQNIPPYIALDRAVSVDSPSYVDYFWYGYMNWFFYLYYVTTADNNREGRIGEHNMLIYKSGELVEFTNITHNLKENGIETVLCYVRTKYKRPYPEIEGYVYKEHLTKWPGRPKYYFYP